MKNYSLVRFRVHAIRSDYWFLKRYIAATLAASLLAILFLQNFATAAPIAAPPSANVTPNFSGVNVLQNADVRGALKNSDSGKPVRIDDPEGLYMKDSSIRVETGMLNIDRPEKNLANKPQDALEVKGLVTIDPGFVINRCDKTPGVPYYCITLGAGGGSGDITSLWPFMGLDVQGNILNGKGTDPVKIDDDVNVTGNLTAKKIGKFSYIKSDYKLVEPSSTQPKGRQAIVICPENNDILSCGFNTFTDTVGNEYQGSGIVVDGLVGNVLDGLPSCRGHFVNGTTIKKYVKVYAVCFDPTTN